MKHKNDSLRWINAQLRVNPLCLVWALLLLSLTSIETHASGIFPVGGGTGSVSSASETQAWNISNRLFEETKKHDTRLSLPERPSDIVPASTALRHEPAADTGIFSAWIDPDTARFNFNLSLQGVSYDGPAQLHAGAVDSGSKSPVVPISTPPSSGLLFVTALVGMLGTVTAVRGESRFKKALPTSDFDPPRLCSSVSVVVLSSDVALATVIERHLHRAGYEARVAAAASEIFTITDPASLLLVLVDCRTQDWDMLRTDSSLHHVLLMAVVPPDCFYTECHFIADLERGMDGVYDLQDGHRLLVAKVSAYLRRARCESARRGVYHVGAIELDGDAHEVTIAGRQVKLTTKPFAILSVLMREPSKVFSRSKLIDLVWGPDIVVGEHTVDVHVHVLRQLLDREPNRLCELLTINRVGFTLRPVSSAGSIRTSRPRPMSNSISDSHTRARMTPRIMSRQIPPRTHRLLMAPPLNSPANTCITSPCG